MRAILLACSLLIAGLAPAPALAQSPSAEAADAAQRQALARRFVSIGGSEDLFVRGAIIGIEATLQQQGVSLSERQRLLLTQTLETSFTAPATVFIDEMTNYFAANSSTADLEAALAYYESETGGRYVVAAIDLVMTLLNTALSGDFSALPATAQTLDPAHDALANRLGAAFLERLSAVEVEQMAVYGLDSGEFANWIGRFVAARLGAADLEAAVLWSESEASQRLERSNPLRAHAEQLAALRAMRAINTEELGQAIQKVLAETPT